MQCNVPATLLALLTITLLGCHPDRGNKESVAPDAVQELTKQAPFPENSIGVAYLDSIEGSRYLLTVFLPNTLLPDSIVFGNRTASYYEDIPLDLPPQTIVLFDDEGELITLNNVGGCVSKFWCENDGGLQYRLAYSIAVEHKDFIRTPKLKNKKMLGDIACFAIANYKPLLLEPLPPEKTLENGVVILKGKILSASKRGTIFAQISVLEDDADSAYYCVHLEAFNTEESFELACCGP